MKKALSFILALVLCLSLCACNVNNDNPTTPSTEPSETEPSETETTNPSSPPPYLSGFGGVTVSIASYSGDYPQDELWFFKLIEEKFDCEVEVIEFANNQIYEEAMAVRLAEGNLPTIFTSFLPIEQIVELGEQGKFVDVMAPENLEKMPNFASIFADNAQVNQEYMMTAAEDGSHYIMPDYDCERAVNHYWVIEEKAFEKAGVEWAGDPDGFLDMLRKLKAYYPQSYPLTGGAWQGILDRVCYTFNVNSSYAAYDWDKWDTGEWYIGATTDAYYDMLSMFQTAYNEGLMHPNMLHTGSGAIQSDITSGTSFIYNSWLGWMTAHNDAFKAVGVDMHTIPAPTPVGPNGKTLEVKKFKNDAGTIINAEDPEAAACAMAIMDWMYNDDDYQGAWYATVGPDECWTTGEDGNKYWTDSESNLHADINMASPPYGMFNSSLCVIYHKECPYYSFNAEEQLAQDIGENVGYFRAPPTLPAMDETLSAKYKQMQTDIGAMTLDFVQNNWTKADFDNWAVDFNETYRDIIDYLNS